MTQKTTAADGLLDEMERESGKAIAELSTSRTRRKPMMWEPLSGSKEPFFGKPYFLYSDHAGSGQAIFALGYLKAKVELETGIEYTWRIEGEQEEQTHFTHFCKPVEA